MMRTAPFMHCLLLLLLLLLAPIVCNAEGGAQTDKPVRLSIEGISASVGEDEPRVLTILLGVRPRYRVGQERNWRALLPNLCSRWIPWHLNATGSSVAT
ncbi:hypothetical protein [Marinobacter sp. AC-23]|uniref:hypothetical protein n=1 Tax=Marinobacter sp. AC-23 TaxID=1879031 RepID=UPI0008DD9E37|nr:hypothetical protein [Marinobacter sp. AC-23]OHY82677.1 hypothetical protein BCA33_00045 [Marinobacter sp. AC-23]